MTDKLYLSDAYVREFDACITAIEENRIMLDRTAFYPTGGGQPCDVGIFEVGDRNLNVLETKKLGDDIVHIVDSVAGVKTGDSVRGTIDWKRRYAHMRYHTALHVIDAVVAKEYSGMITGNQIYSDRCRLDLDVPDLGKEKSADIIKNSQKEIDRNLPVVVKFLSKEQALEIKDLARTKPGEELLKVLTVFRVVDIVGLDMQLDGGTHVANTKEIGKIELSKYESRGAHNKRIEIRIVD
jgi:misacylated tRNA(Ala) deacylase